MKKEILQIKNLSVSADHHKILTGINITVNEGEIHALLGPNGNGKSTLLQTIMNNPDYQVTKGDILFEAKSIKGADVTEIAKSGIFLSFQNPTEIEGVLNLDFLRTYINIINDKKTNLVAFYNTVQNGSKGLKLPNNYLERFLNYGFSGGEKKTNELLLLKLKQPKLALIDEIDSGLDVDALKTVTKTITELQVNNKFSALIVSHYDNLYNSLNITKFHVIIDGKIICSGDRELLHRIQKEGYNWVYSKYKIKQSISEQVILDSCGIKHNTR